jgi:hypothetical protein
MADLTRRTRPGAFRTPLDVRATATIGAISVRSLHIEAGFCRPADLGGTLMARSAAPKPIKSRMCEIQG